MKFTRKKEANNKIIKVLVAIAPFEVPGNNKSLF
jgi:hypothetical protein